MSIQIHTSSGSANPLVVHIGCLGASGVTAIASVQQILHLDVLGIRVVRSDGSRLHLDRTRLCFRRMGVRREPLFL